MKKNRTENLLAVGALLGLLLLFATFLFDGAVILTISAMASFALVGICLAFAHLAEQLPQMSQKMARHAKIGVGACVMLLLTTALVVYAADLPVTNTTEYQYKTTDTLMPVDLDISATKEDDGSVVIDAQGKISVVTKTESCNNKKVVVKVTNNSGAAIRIQPVFGNTISCKHSDGSTITSNNETILAATNYLSFEIESGENSNGSSNSGTIQFNSIKYVCQDVQRVTNFIASDFGTYIVSYEQDGKHKETLVTSDVEIELPEKAKYVLTASPEPGYELYAWYSCEYGLIFGADFYAFPGIENTVEPLFRKTGSAIYLIAETGRYFAHLDEAIAAVSTLASDDKKHTIVVCADGVAYDSKTKDSSFSLTIPKNVTLLIPKAGGQGADLSMPEAEAPTYKNASPSKYCELKLGRGANLTVEGVLCVDGLQSGTMPQNGWVIRGHGQISMADGSTIKISDGGKLYAWGYIVGDGIVEALDGSEVRECFQIADFRGGTAMTTSGLATGKNNVFPVSQYYLQNIEVPLKLYAGAQEYGASAFNMSSSLSQTSVAIIGGEGDAGVFQIKNGYIIKDYIEGTGRSKYSICGDVALNSTTLELYGKQIDSSKYNFPIPGHMTIEAVSGTININQDLALLPGSEMYVCEDATVVLGTETTKKRIIVYDVDNWGGYCGSGSSRYVALSYVPGGGGTTGREKDALVQIDGVVNAANGYIYTTYDVNSDGITFGGANILSEGMGVLVAKKGSDTKTYQATQSGSSVSWKEIKITPAVLQNGDTTNGATLSIDADATYYYCLYNDMWIKGDPANHNEAIRIEDPTCKAVGEVIVTCGTETRTVETIATVPHVWNVQSQSMNTHTCACAYGCTTNVILNLEFRLDDYLWLNGYTAEGYLTDPADGVTVSDNIQTVVANNVRYFVKAIPADEIPDELTFTISVSGGTATFTVSLEDYVVPASQEKLKKALLDYGNAAKDYFEKTYEKEGTSGYKKPGYSLIAPDKENTIMGFQPFGNVNIVTQGATIYFDEALRLAVKYRLSGLESNVVKIGDVDYTVVQVGLLVKELTNWEMGAALTTSTAGCTAYLAYNTADVEITSGGVENRPNSNLDGETEANLDKFNLSGMITFDLKSEDYASGFALRTYVVLQDANGNYQCVYGKQYGYGLGAYINAMYNENATVAADRSFNYLLEKVWALAQETAK